MTVKKLKEMLNKAGENTEVDVVIVDENDNIKPITSCTLEFSVKDGDKDLFIIG